MNAASIKASLKAKGQAMTLTKNVAGTFDPETGAITGATNSTSTVYGITSSYRDGITSRPDSLILAGDKQAIVDAIVKPLPGDTLTIQGEVWKVIAVDSIDPQGSALLHKCQIRK